MAIIGTQKTVTTSSALQLTQFDALPQTTVFVRNTDATNSVFLGGDSTVTATGGGNPGYELKAGQTVGPLIVAPRDQVWAIATGGSVRVDVIETDVA